MDRFYKSGAAATPPSDPGVSSGDFPTVGNPQTATPATMPGAYWFYMITESLRNVVLAAGLTPNKLSLNLLRDAIVSMIATAVQNALTPTGMLAMFARQTAPNGWVRFNGESIGDASSAASERAHADCHDLYVHLWNSFPQSVFPVIGGRGSSAEADWLAHKRLTLINHQGLYMQAWDYTGSFKAGQSLGGLIAGQVKKHTHTYNGTYPGQHGGGGAMNIDAMVGSVVATGETGGNFNEVDSRCWLLCVKL